MKLDTGAKGGALRRVWSFLRWLFKPELLQHPPESEAPAPAPPSQGFLRWLLSKETLPNLFDPDRTPPEAGLLRFILQREQLPSVAPVTRGKRRDGNAPTTGRNDA